MTKRSDIYFAADEADKAVAEIRRKADAWYDTIISNNHLSLMKRSWEFYYGRFHEEGHSVTFGGESGEIVNLGINHYRNIASNMLTMITSNRPTFKTRAINTDLESQVQTVLANGLLEYYMREKRLENFLKQAVETSIVFGAGFIKMEWNATSGEIYDTIEPEMVINPETGEEEAEKDEDGNEKKAFPIYEGDVQFTNLTPLDVVFDSTKEDINQVDWVIIRTFKNRHDLAAKYPELKEEILAQHTKDEVQHHMLSLSALDQTDDIPLYEFYHKRTESMPDGRYLLYLDEETILMDTPMPYRELPIYRMSPSDILGTPFGYSPMFDLLPIQESVNALYSTIMTNQNTFGVQNILNPRGNDVMVNQVGGGMNFIEYNAAAGRPEALNLTSTPPEIFNFLQMLEKSMETVSGINSVVRGDPAASLKSGAALATVQTQAIQFMNGIQQSYIMLIEGLGTGLIKLLQDFAAVPRIAEISGKVNKSKMQHFSNKDIDKVNRVVVDVGNALSQTAAGRTQMATELIQMGLVTSPEQYYSVLNTGRLETMTEGSENHNLLIRAENEQLVDMDEDIFAIATDKHSLHIREHMNVLADPDLRRDPDLVARVMAHIQEHIDLSRTTDPDLLAMIGEQPLGPPGGSPVGPGNAAPQQPSGQSLDSASQLSQGMQQQGPQAAEPASPATIEGQPSTPQEQFTKNT